ncbi:MAG TPA: hypothetical protein VGW74_01010, partial [Propionibacteriaceae bacterium]|nr:hypothetical protein [Propionibacteriaceae bacterium]
MTKTRRRNVLRAAALGTAGLMLAVGVSACSITPQPDQITLHYKGGPINGNKFDRVIDPGGQEYNWTVADTDVVLPTSLRTWNIAADDGADQTEPIVVPTSDGVLVNVWMQANFVLNTNYEDIDGYKGGTIRKFWEEIGRRYGADTEEGWDDMMLVTVVPALEKAATDTIRAYAADPLVYNTDGIYVEVQESIGDRFLENLKRLSGGDFFCGPTFVRGSGGCPAPELILRGIDFANPAIQDARDQRRTEEELAQAR